MSVLSTTACHCKGHYVSCRGLGRVLVIDMLYRIYNWDGIFENNRTKELKSMGLGYRSRQSWLRTVIRNLWTTQTGLHIMERG